MLNNGGFFNNIGEIDNKQVNFFTNTDVESVLGKNLVKNFVGKIEFEIKFMGFSETANEIAEYYEECKINSSIVEFINNTVIKMILKEIEDNYKVKNYLYERIFDDVNLEYLQKMEDDYKNQENLYKDTKIDEMNYKKEQILKERRRKEQIKKIMNDKNCSEKQAIKYLDEIEKNKQLQIIEKDIENSFKKFLLPIETKIDFPNIDLKRTNKNLGNLIEEIENFENNTKDTNKDKNNNSKTVFYIDDDIDDDFDDDIDTKRFFEL